MSRSLLSGTLLLTLVLVISGQIPVPAEESVRLSMKPLDLTRPPTTTELVAAGQFGGPLTPTGEVADLERKEEINLSFGQAIQAWNDHAYPQAVGLFREHIEEFPDSPWAAEARLHLGCDAQYHGRYSEAREHFSTILSRHLGVDHPGSRTMVDKARSRLGGIDVFEYDFESAAENFRLVKKESSDWRLRTYAAHWLQRLSRYRGAEAELLICGLQALAHWSNLNGLAAEARSILESPLRSASGHSVQQIVELAASHGIELQARRIEPAELSRLTLPAIVQIQGQVEGRAGHYWVIESLDAGLLRVHDPQTRRTFDQTFEEFAQEWQGVVLVEAGPADPAGQALSVDELANLRGGCCGAYAPVDNGGKPGRNGSGPQPEDPCPPKGGDAPMNVAAPVWEVNMISLNFYVNDVPIWYQPAYGPRVQFELSYNSQSATAYHEPFGPKWQFNYASYAVVDTGGAVLIFMPDGRRDQYIPAGPQNFIAPFGVHNELVSTGTDTYELTFTDGTTFVYSRPLDIQGEPLTQILLTGIRDTYGQGLQFAYDGSGQMISVTDAVGQVSTLSYDGSGRVTGIADPFGRTVTLTYDTEGNLAGISDMGGYVSTFTYDADRYITSIDGARGRWQFYTEPSEATGLPDRYPPPGGPMWANYRITVTDPLDQQSEYFWYGGCETGFGCRGTSWYVSPRDYVEYRTSTHNNYVLQVPRKRWVPLDHVSGLGQIKRIITPEGRDWNYLYDPAGNVIEAIDSFGNSTHYTYNALQRVTSITDRLDILTEYIYAPNDLDVIEIRDVLGSTHLEYNTARDVTAITDRLGKRTEFTYNGLGQLSSWTDPEGNKTSFAYGPGVKPQNAARAGLTLFSRSFDARGRPASHTRSTGLTEQMTLDDLDRLTQLEYPDGLSEAFAYHATCVGQLETVTDRSGKTIQLVYDGLSRLVETKGADGSRTSYTYDPNGNLVEIANRAGVKLRFEYDLDNRMTKREYDDGLFELFEWDKEGRPSATINARGVRIDYGRDLRGDLTSASFADSTPDVTFIRDDAGRITQRDDGLGTTTYSYDLESRIKQVDGPWPADLLEMDYDSRGLLTDVTVAGGASTTYDYDALGRLTQASHGSSAFDFSYTGASALEDSRTAPTGTTTTYLYDTLDRLQSIAHRRVGGQLISSYSSTFGLTGQRATETMERSLASPSAAARKNVETSNPLDQLVSSTAPARSYVYDEDGNLTQGHVAGGYPFVATYDAENHLTSVEWTDGVGQVQRQDREYDGNGWLARIVERVDGGIVRERRFVRGPGWILQERDASNGIVAEYAWDRRKPGGVGGLLLRRAGGVEHVYLYDGKGNVTEVIDSGENVVASYDYDPFGALTAVGGTLEQDFGFATKPLDEATGLIDFGWRAYSPSMARWTRRDPIREKGGLNLYAFVDSDPLNQTDAWGLIPLNRLPSGGLPAPDGGGSGSDAVADPCDCMNLPPGATCKPSQRNWWNRLLNGIKNQIGKRWGDIVDGVGGDPDKLIREVPNAASEARG